MPLGSEANSAQPLVGERLERVSGHAPAGFFETNANGALTLSTSRWQDITGIAVEPPPPCAWLTGAHPDDAPRLEAAWRHTLASGSALDIRYRALVRGKLAFLRTLLEPVRDAASNIVRYAGVTIDVSPQSEHLAQAMPQLVWVAGADGTIQYVNDTWVQYTGLRVEQLQGGGAREAVHPDEAGTTWERWGHALVTQDAFEIEHRLRRASDGVYRWFLARATPVRNDEGRVTHWVGTATDIDAQKRAYANLRFVLETGASLASSYDVNVVCQNLARLAVNHVSDWCFVVLAEPAQSERRTVMMAHRTPALFHLLEQVRDSDAALRIPPIETAIRKKVPFLITQRENAFSPLEMRSAMVVPIANGRGEAYGALVLGSSQPGHSFTQEDLEVAEMVAQRAASAIHTARAFDEERRRSNESRFIARAGEIVFESLDLHRTFDRLSGFLVQGAADLTYIMLLENGDTLRTIAGAHRDPDKERVARRLLGVRTLRPKSEEAAIHMLAHHRASVHPSIPLGAVLANVWEYLAPEVQALDIRSAITVPLHSRGETFGALVVYRCGEGAIPYQERDLPAFEDIGRRLSIAIDHAGTLARERRISEALQKALLPQPETLPSATGIRFVAEYRASSQEADVGGDWYDAFALPDGSIAVSIGDVTGRGLAAAGLMGKLRQGMAMATMYESDPARILDAVDHHLRTRNSSAIATAFIGIIDPGRKCMRYAVAGHPPPLLRREGELLELRSGGLPLGLRDAAREESQTISLDGAQLLLLYTDGLIEATRDVAFGERRLRQMASSEAILFVHNAARFLCDACLPLDAQDDTAVLTISFGERAHWAFDAENAQAAHEARSQFRAHLESNAGPEADFDAAELIFGELVGNVVRHAPGPIDVQVQWTQTHPVLHVTDRGKGFIRNPALPLDPLSESGRGLYIISLLAKSVFVERIPGYGHHVAAELNIPRNGAV